MDAELAAEVLRRAKGPEAREVKPDTGYVGDGVLSCAECGAAVIGAAAIRGWTPDLLAADYDCTGCGKVHAPVAKADGELHDLVRAKWSDAAWVAAWRVATVEELDAELAEARAVHEWCLDDQQAHEVARRLSRAVGYREPWWSMYFLAKHAVEVVNRRTALRENQQPGARSLQELRAASSAFGSMYLDTMHRPNPLLWTPSHNRQLRAKARAYGGRKQRNARLAELDARLWELLAEREWRDPDLAALWEDQVLADEWAKSPQTQVKRRRAMVVAAVGDGRLAVRRRNGDEARIVRPEE
ncbi:hypothetical protein [Amycolatopsis jejuensis]|uniref:hypothetical protein n=1 Tax=Amycolatopsis jejuensis TaxID=330084 RepID=UPI0005278ED0|nr:hypothetical protein [Amycolatopsis jejuensis]